MDEHLLRFNTKSKFEFFDFETFNLCLNFCYNRPWQVGMVTVQNGKIIDSYESYVKWQVDLKIGEGAAKITNFNQELYDQRAVDEALVFPIMYERFEKADFIVGHNILNFDVYLIKDWCKIHNKPWKHLMNKLYDTRAIAVGIKRQIAFNKSNESLLEYFYKLVNTPVKGLKTKLEILGKEFSIEHDYEKLHDAINDLELNVKIWNKLIQQAEI